MASSPSNNRPPGQPCSPRRRNHVIASTKGSPTLHLHSSRVSPDTAKCRSLSKSVTEFFSKLRPSKRPERGGTARPAADNDAEHAPARPTPPAGCRRKRSSSLGPHGPDTIPPDRWNTAITPPRRAHSVGSRARRKSVAAVPSSSPKRTTTTATNLPARKPPPISHENRGPPKRQNRTHPSLPPPAQQHSFTHSHSLPIPFHLPSAAEVPTSHVPTPRSRDLYLAHRAHRHERRTLLSSGDFLGVTGANPYTGEPDIITPPTSASSAIISSSSSSYWPTSSALAAALAQGRDGGDRVVWTQEGNGAGAGGGRGEEAQRREKERARLLEKGLRRMAKEEERLCRAEQRKNMVREVLMQGGRVKWRKEEGGWSSVAEPKLSPILQSLQGSGKSSGSGGQEGMRLSRQQGGSFLETAAAATGLESCRRRYANGEGVILLAHRQQPRQTKPEMVLGQDAVGGLAALSKVVVRLCLPPVVPRRKSSHQWNASRLQDPYPEWELGTLIVIPVDLHRLSEDCRLQQISTGRVLELDNLDPAEPSTGKALRKPRRADIRPGGMLQASSAKGGRPLSQECPSVCTRTITTTGFEHSQPHPLAVGHLFGAMLDGLREAPLMRRALTPRALSRPTSTQFSTTRSNDACSSQLASPSSMQLNVWPSFSNLGQQTTKTTTTTTSTWKMLGTSPEQESRIPLRPLKPGPDSAITSSPTDQEAAAHAQENVAPTPVQHMDGAADRHPREKPDWAMRKTMRNPPDLHPTHHNDEVPDNPKSSPTYTRSSTSPTALAVALAQPQLQSPKATASAQQREAVTIARASARIAFTQNPDSRRALPVLVSGRTPLKATPRPVSAPDTSRAKPASAAGAEPRPGTGQQGKQKGKGKGEKKEKKTPGHGDGKGTITVPGESKGGQKEKSKAEGGKEKVEAQNKRKGKEFLAPAPGSPEVEEWMRNAVLILARVVGAYWQVVSPVFDGNSELRKRLDKAQATRGDLVVCVLAVVFLFLVMAVGVWTVRGIVCSVRLLGVLGEVLGTVAGLRD